jgi:excisionase family DNA binding protein
MTPAKEHAMTTTTPTYLRLQEVADLLRVSTQTIRRWVHEGKLPPPVGLGRKQLWEAAAVEEALRGRRSVAPERSEK